MARKHKHEEHVNHERYLVSYADLMTLLTALFIILFSMSVVNEEKVKILANSLSIAFNQGSSSILDLNDSGMYTRKETTLEEVETMKAIKENNNLRKIKQKIDEEAKTKNLEDRISATINENGLKIVLTNEVLFNSGESELKEDSKTIIKIISDLMVEIDNNIQINGFTDNVPISTIRFPSNWELSASRSLSVLQYMFEENPELDPKRFSATGYGEYQPIDSNETVEGRQKNRRVEIIIERKNGDSLLKTENTKQEVEK